MAINESGRKKIIIVKLLEKRKVNEAEVQEFTAHLEGEENNAKHGVWARALDEYIKEGATIDCDVVVKKSDKVDPEGNPYYNRKITQIYVDGKPALEKKPFGGYQRQDKERIEKEVAIKEIGECWRTGKFKDDDILVSAYRAWLLGRMSPPTPSSTPETKATASPKAESSTQQPTKPLPASHSEVQRKLNKIIHENIWTIERAIKELVDRGGVGKDSLEKIKSLKPDKLQELNQAIEDALKPVQL